MKHSISNHKIQNAFDKFEGENLAGALELRELILDEAKALGIGSVKECLRWGQPSYISSQGTALRIGTPKTGGFALYAHCQSSVISDFASQVGAEFQIEGNRAIHFKSKDDIHPEKLRLLIAHALQYHS